MSLPVCLEFVGWGGVQASIQAPLEHFDGPAQPHPDVGAGDMEKLGRLPGREPFDHTHLDYLAVGVREKPDHFPQQGQHLPLLSQIFGRPIRSLDFYEGNFPLPPPLAIHILGRVGHDPTHPRTRLGAIEVRTVDCLKDLDPTDLKSILGEAVVSGNAPGQREEALGATADPIFQVAFQEGTVCDFRLERRVGENLQALGHRVSWNSISGPNKGDLGGWVELVRIGTQAAVPPERKKNSRS